jgi:hypothetical protein
VVDVTVKIATTGASCGADFPCRAGVPSQIVDNPDIGSDYERKVGISSANYRLALNPSGRRR